MSCCASRDSSGRTPTDKYREATVPEARQIVAQCEGRSATRRRDSDQVDANESGGHPSRLLTRPLDGSNRRCRERCEKSRSRLGLWCRCQQGGSQSGGKPPHSLASPPLVECAWLATAFDPLGNDLPPSACGGLPPSPFSVGESHCHGRPRLIGQHVSCWSAVQFLTIRLPKN